MVRSSLRPSETVLLVAVLSFLALAGIAHAEGFGGPGGGQLGYCNGGVWCPYDAYNTSGNQTIKICSDTGTAARDFNIWYGNVGPFNLSAPAFRITRAQYADGTPYNNTVGLTNATGGGCVEFVLNGTNAPFTNQTKMVNVTVFGSTSYPLALAQGNGTMFTINYAVMETRTAGSVPLGGAVFMTINNATKQPTCNGPALTDSSGYWAEHCMGTVAGGYCLNETPATSPGICRIHGTPFPNWAGNCPINMTISSIRSFDFVSTNVSTVQNITPGTVLQINLVAPSAIGFVMASGFSSSPGAPSFISPSNMTVTNYNTGDLIYTSSGGSSPEEGVMPFFVNANVPYYINMGFSNGGVVSYPFMAPSPGMTGAQPILTNSSDPPQFTTVIGKVVNESGATVAGAMVYAQFYKGGGGAFGINFINSTLTDANGKFSLTVPRTQNANCGMGSCQFPVYQFFIVSNRTSATNVPMYFPTVDTNGGRGYFAQSATVVIPALVVKAGGQVNVNVTLNGVGMIMGELNKFTQLGTGLNREDTTGKFSMISLFSGVSVPPHMMIPFVSPVSGVVVNLLGKNQTMGGGDPSSGPLVSACFNTSATVTQGAATNIVCNLTQHGNLSLSMETCNDLFQCSQASQEQLGSFDFWFQTNGILRGSDGNAVAYYSPDGTVLQDLLGFGGISPTVNLPVPPGTYTFEFAPGFEWSDYTGVRNSTAFTISPGQATSLSFRRGRSWQISPMFNPSMIFSADNSINISVRGLSVLNTSYVTLNGTKVLFPNRTIASSQTITFGYDPDRMGGVFYNNTFRPSALGLGAGKYLLLMNATSANGSMSYTTTNVMPINAYDFQVGIDTGGFAFGAGQSVSMKIFAYNSSGPIPANTSRISVEMFDQAGAAVAVSAKPSGIIDGQGTLNVTMPSTLGFYEFVVTVPAAGGKFGVSDNWMQVTALGIKLSSGKPRYQPTDTVQLVVQVSNSSSGQALQGASVQAVIDNGNTPAFGTTGSDGKATISLNPSTYGTNNGQWSFGWHNLQIKISKETAGDVLKLDTWFGFDVRGMELFMRTDRPVYSQGDNVTLEMFGAPGFTIMTVKADGVTLSSCMEESAGCPAAGKTFLMSDVGGAGDYKYMRLGSWAVGHHDLQITASYGGSTQTFYNGFDVSSFSIMLSTDSFSYNVNNNATLSVKANYPNGTAVGSQPVTATLYKAQPPNDISVMQVSGTTDSSGLATLELNATKPGFNYIRVNVSNQFQFIGMQVSTIKATLLSGAGGSVVSGYTVLPGDTVTIRVNASSGGQNVPDGTLVSARLWAFGNPVDLPTNTTVNGNATLSFPIPSFAPAQAYDLEVRVTTAGGDQGFAPPATLTVAGGSALQMEVRADRSFMNPYMPGDTATLIAALKYPNGTAASGHNITFETGSEGGMPQTIGTALTGSDGSATKSFSVTSNHTDGPYYIHTYLTESSDVQQYSGFLVSSLKVNATTDREVYSPGDNIVISATLLNRTTGAQVNATSGFVSIFTQGKGEIKNYFTVSGTQPYQLTIPVPNDTSAIGTYPMGIVMFSGRSQGSGFAMVEVRNSSSTLDLGLPASITAGTPFNINITASAGSTASLKVFSPAATSMFYDNSSVGLNASGAIVNMTIDSPGLYVFNTYIEGIGSVKSVMKVLPSSSEAAPAVWTGTASANATSFTTSQDVYVYSNVANSTAVIMKFDSGTSATVSYSLPLTLTSGSNYYGVYSSGNLASGTKYFVRLDTGTSTGMVSSMFGTS